MQCCYSERRTNGFEFALADVYLPAAALLVALMAPWAPSLSVALAVGTAAHHCCSSALFFNTPSLAALSVVGSRSNTTVRARRSLSAGYRAP